MPNIISDLENFQFVALSLLDLINNAHCFIDLIGYLNLLTLNLLYARAYYHEKTNKQVLTVSSYQVRYFCTTKQCSAEIGFLPNSALKI